MDTKEPKEQKEQKLTTEELKMLSQVLYNNRWSGQDWEQVIKPLINKIALIISGQSFS